MNALVIALLTAGSTFAAVFPLMKSGAARLGRSPVPVIEVEATKACRRISMPIIRSVQIIRAPNHQGLRLCGSTRNRPCVRRRWH